MRPLTFAEVRHIKRLKTEGYCNKEIAHRSGRSTNAVGRVLRGVANGKQLKVSGMDKIDIHHWWKARKAIPTMAQMARKYRVTHQYLRNICYEMDRA